MANDENAGQPKDLIGLLDPAQRQAMEQLSLNLARAAMTTQTALGAAMLRQSESSEPLNADPFQVAPALGEVMPGSRVSRRSPSPRR
jgi:polyhydroxyalkanoate synthase